MLETIHLDPGSAFGVVPSVIVVVWRLPVTTETYAVAESAFTRAAARLEGPFALLSIAEPTSSPPKAAVRARIESFLLRLPGLVASVGVIEGGPRWLAQGLDTNQRIAAAVAARRRTKVCVDAREAITWLLRQRELGLDDALRPVLLGAIESLRAQIPDAADPGVGSSRSS